MNKHPFIIGIIAIGLMIGGYFYTDKTPETTELETAYPTPPIINKSIILPAESTSKYVVKSKQLPTKRKTYEELSIEMREIKKCYPSIVSKSNQAVEDAFEQLSAGREFQDVIDFKNYHYTLPDGEKRRLQIRLDEDTKGNQFFTLKLFKVDKEGLPDPIKLDPKISKNPSEETIEQFLREGSIHFTQDIGNRIFSDRDYISFVKEDGRIQSLEVYRNNKVLRCSVDIHEHTQCKCSD